MSPSPILARGHLRPTLGCALVAIFFCCGFAGDAALDSAQAPAPRGDTRGTIRAQVDLVTVIASVLDKDHHPAANLTADQFEIYEEGVRQKIDLFEPDTQSPLDLALMIDCSLSETQELEFEREAASAFIGQVVRPTDRMAVFGFSDAVDMVAGFSGDASYLQSSLRRLEPGAGTAMYDAVYLGSQALGRNPQGRRRVIVLVTDAGETTSHANFNTARDAAVRADALLYTICVRAVTNEGGRNTAGEHALETIADTTGGAIYYLDSLKELGPTFDQINRELRTQYRIGYYPDPKPPQDTYRSIDVEVPGDYTVHSRKTYYTGKAPD
ncbi:MAG: VWA domain-containing protein [Candidatus Acidiferrales bacterium]